MSFSACLSVSELHIDIDFIWLHEQNCAKEAIAPVGCLVASFSNGWIPEQTEIYLSRCPNFILDQPGVAVWMKVLLVHDNLNLFKCIIWLMQESTILLGNPGFKALSTSSYFGSTKVQRAPQSTTQNSSTAEAMHEPLMQTSKIPVRLVIGEDSNQIPAWHPEDSDRTLHCRENLGRLSSFGELKDVSRRLSGRSCTESCSRVNWR